MAVQVLLPKLGLTMETGLIEEWLVEPGTPVKPGDPLLRLTTDKVDVEVEAEDAGLFHPVAETGRDLPPGALIGWLLDEGEQLPEPAGTAGRAAPAAAEPEPTRTANSTGRLFASPNARRVARESGVDLGALRGTGPNGRIVTADVLEARPAAGHVGSPLVRRAAVAAGVDLGAVPASGPGGRITRSDVAAAASSSSSAADVIPLTGMRGVIAERMHASLHEMAQLTLGTDADLDAAIALRAQLKQEWTGPIPTITDLVVRAAALALLEHPRLNATVRDDAVHVRSAINVGIAVALADGLLVPVVKNADRTPLSALAAESRRLAEAARTNKLALPDLEGGTFTVSTLGSYGIDFFTPVITPGQVAILGVGRLRDSVRWEGDVPRRSQVLTLSLTFDHRAVDGAPAAAYLRAVVDRLQHPLTLLS